MRRDRPVILIGSFCALAIGLAACQRRGGRAADSATAAADMPALPRTAVRGEVFLSAGDSLPNPSVIRVELRDAARPESVTTILATQEFTAATQGSPWSFELQAPDSLVQPDARLVVSARVNTGDRLLYASGDDVPVTALVHSGPLRIELLPVTMSEGTGADPGRQRVTPAPSLAVRCGRDEFRLAFDAAAVYVNTADDTTIVLPRLTQPGGEDPATPRTFTNGRLTFVQEIGGDERLLFARGRMVPAPCNRR